MAMKFLCASLLALSLLGVGGCATLPTDPPKPPVTKANQILVFVDIFGAGVQAACGVVQPAIVGTNPCREVKAGSDWTAIEIEMVLAANTARAVLSKADAGWQAAFKAGWLSVRPRFDTIDLPYVVWTSLIVVDSLVASL